MAIGERPQSIREEKKLSQGDIEKHTGLLRATSPEWKTVIPCRRLRQWVIPCLIYTELSVSCAKGMASRIPRPPRLRKMFWPDIACEWPVVRDVAQIAYATTGKGSRVADDLHHTPAGRCGRDGDEMRSRNFLYRDKCTELAGTFISLNIPTVTSQCA